MRPDEIDAVTIDAYGTLLELRDPVGELQRVVPGRPRDAVARAFELEVEYYAAHAHEARDEASLSGLHAACARVFGDALGTAVAVDDFVAALRFGVLDGVPAALERLRRRGLALAVVANWDYGLHGHLRDAGLEAFFATVVTAGEAGARKPAPAPFLLATERLGVRPERTLHVGDHPEHDGAGALAAGLRFAPAPLAHIDRQWT